LHSPRATHGYYIDRSAVAEGAAPWSRKAPQAQINLWFWQTARLALKRVECAG